MKKNVLLVALIVFSITIHAQTIIPKIGFTVAKIAASEEGDGENKSKLGLTLGAAVEIPFKDNFSFQPELLFIQKGGKYTYSEDDESSETKETINYLEIPVLFKVTFGDATKFYANAGPSFGFAIGGKYKYEENIDGDTDSESGDLKFGSGEEDDYKGLDLGFQLGGGVLIADKYIIDLRYGLGLSNISNEEEGDFTLKNRVLQITFGMPLNLFK
jgi:opacity protein-like surface antigen